MAATNTSFRDPIDMDGVSDVVLGEHTYDADLYDPKTLKERMPPYYRTGKTRDGNLPLRNPSSPSERAWSVEAVADFIRSANNDPQENDLPEKQRGADHEDVALTPTEEELEDFKDEYDAGERQYEPHFVRVPFFSHRVVGSRGTAGAYILAINNARNADDPRFAYNWEADYENGTVTIEVWEVNDD